MLDPGPIKWDALAGLLLQRLTIGDERLFELRRLVLALSQGCQRKAQIVLGHSPVERHALAGLLRQRLAIGDDGLFELRRPAFALPKQR